LSFNWSLRSATTHLTPNPTNFVNTTTFLTAQPTTNTTPSTSKVNFKKMSPNFFFCKHALKILWSIQVKESEKIFLMVVVAM
jgi:hypothetical protein